MEALYALARRDYEVLAKALYWRTILAGRAGDGGRRGPADRRPRQPPQRRVSRPISEWRAAGS